MGVKGKMPNAGGVFPLTKLEVASMFGAFWRWGGGSGFLGDHVR